MKQRTTFILPSPDPTNPDNLHLSSTSLSLRSLPPSTAREDRYTFARDELPFALRFVMIDYPAIYIHWASGRQYKPVDPYAARVPAGFHIFVPWALGSESTPNHVFGNHYGLEEEFTEIPGGNQFYQPMKSVMPLTEMVAKVACKSEKEECVDKFRRVVDGADYIGVEYNEEANTVTVSVFYGGSEEVGDGGGVEITKESGEEKVEVGLLMHEKPMGDESFTLGGQVHVIGTEKINPVLFTFPSRHHTHPTTFTTHLPSPTGLHPTLHLTLTAPNPTPHDSCTLHTYLTIPHSLFPDQYQLSTSNPHLLSSLNLTRIVYLSGETDLEAPTWTTRFWGSTLLLELTPTATSFALPLHLRYLPPAPENRTSETIDFPVPVVFWACNTTVHNEEERGGVNPFERRKLGWEEHFEDKTVFHYLAPENGGWVQVGAPVLDLRSAEIVKWGTVVVIFSGFVWVLEKVMTALVGARRGSEGEEKKRQ
ncbi:PIG-X-domain-containing protein [Ascodesmis nigricans]|uniref:Protein PBN1 n=1 Tax=Ascodesmis nigricans TaxID=341454 RepID=A0A4S2N4Q7_9PEZI|nr:PIG-X-domain-containing protein [Ascodesmis nigricans]